MPGRECSPAKRACLLRKHPHPPRCKSVPRLVRPTRVTAFLNQSPQHSACCQGEAGPASPLVGICRGLGPELTLHGVAKLWERSFPVRLTAAKLEAWEGGAFKIAVHKAGHAVLSQYLHLLVTTSGTEVKSRTAPTRRPGTRVPTLTEIQDGAHRRAITRC